MALRRRKIFQVEGKTRDSSKNLLPGLSNLTRTDLSQVDTWGYDSGWPFGTPHLGYQLPLDWKWPKIPKCSNLHTVLHNSTCIKHETLWANPWQTVVAVVDHPFWLARYMYIFFYNFITNFKIFVLTAEKFSGIKFLYIRFQKRCLNYF